MREHWWLPTRIDGEEWLDQGCGTLWGHRPESRRSRPHQSLARRNAGASYLYPRIRRCQTDRVRVLDLGLEAVPIRRPWRDGHVAGISLQIYALDLRLAHLRWARRSLQTWPEIVLFKVMCMLCRLLKAASIS